MLLSIPSRERETTNGGTILAIVTRGIFCRPIPSSIYSVEDGSHPLLPCTRLQDAPSSRLSSRFETQSSYVMVERLGEIGQSQDCPRSKEAYLYCGTGSILSIAPNRASTESVDVTLSQFVKASRWEGDGRATGERERFQPERSWKATHWRCTRTRCRICTRGCGGRAD